MCCDVDYTYAKFIGLVYFMLLIKVGTQVLRGSVRWYLDSLIEFWDLLSVPNEDRLIVFWYRVSLQGDVRFVTLIAFTVGAGEAGTCCWR